jgi:hypothetical protein
VEVMYLWGDNSVQMLAIGANVSIARLLWKKRQVGVWQFKSGTCSWVDQMQYCLMTLFNCISAITCS